MSVCVFPHWTTNKKLKSLGWNLCYSDCGTDYIQWTFDLDPKVWPSDGSTCGFALLHNVIQMRNELVKHNVHPTTCRNGFKHLCRTIVIFNAAEQKYHARMSNKCTGNLPTYVHRTNICIRLSAVSRTVSASTICCCIPCKRESLLMRFPQSWSLNNLSQQENYLLQSLLLQLQSCITSRALPELELIHTKWHTFSFIRLRACLL